ncbi:hypothetical protein T01_10475 [Trichinella spiralis]|uniref:Uncharacterized protein n=1 Tax=Trichinella spiralis TaxID=6334 RepID=A0A0V1BG43_TRISP|nr:hypothetical protein T01_10475 [Trichinella spiralis]
MKTTSCAHAEECPFSRLVVCVEKLHRRWRWCCRHVRQRFNPINVQACASFRFTSVVRGAVWKKRIVE